MTDEVVQQLLSAQNGIEVEPTAAMMMMNSTTTNGNDSIDSESMKEIQKRQENRIAKAVHSNSPAVPSTITDLDDDLLLEDETILERIIALKEIFPESVQNAAGELNRALISASKLMYSKGRSTVWWISSTMCVLVFPILIQRELLQVAEQMSREQRSILLGPQAATGPISGGAF